MSQILASPPFYRETGRLSSIVLHIAWLRSIPQYLFTYRIPVLLLRIWLNVFSLQIVQVYGRGSVLGSEDNHEIGMTFVIQQTQQNDYTKRWALLSLGKQ
jgi:hypothetical protein